MFKMKKLLSMALTVGISVTTFATEAVDKATLIETVMEVTLNGGDTWKKEFDIESFGVEDHNTVDFSVTQVTGKYYVLIYDYSGDLYFESNILDGSNYYYTMSNADPDETYTMAVINNVADQELKFKVKIESYIKE